LDDYHTLTTKKSRFKNRGRRGDVWEKKRLGEVSGWSACWGLKSRPSRQKGKNGKKRRRCLGSHWHRYENRKGQPESEKRRSAKGGKNPCMGKQCSRVQGTKDPPHTVGRSVPQARKRKRLPLKTSHKNSERPGTALTEWGGKWNFGTGAPRWTKGKSGY